MSFYIGKDNQTGSKYVYSSAKKSKYTPVYDTMYLQKFKEPEVVDKDDDDSNTQVSLAKSDSDDDKILGLDILPFVLIIVGVVMLCCICPLIILLPMYMRMKKQKKFNKVQGGHQILATESGHMQGVQSSVGNESELCVQVAGENPMKGTE